jgi:hypothetical protein
LPYKHSPKGFEWGGMALHTTFELLQNAGAVPSGIYGLIFLYYNWNFLCLPLRTLFAELPTNNTEQFSQIDQDFRILSKWSLNKTENPSSPYPRALY